MNSYAICLWSKLYSTVTAVDQTGGVKRTPIDTDAANSSVMRSVVYVNHNHEFSYGKKAIERYVSDVANGKIAKKKLVSTG